MVFISSPKGARDLLGRRDAFVDRGTLSWMAELRGVVGGNLLNLVHDEWLPRRRALQPIFSKATRHPVHWVHRRCDRTHFAALA